MYRTMLTLLALSLSAIVSTGCERPSAAASDGIRPSVVSPAELAKRLETSVPPKVFDANGADTREKFGVVPGATLLSGSSNYDLGVLPAKRDDALVFYCANARCSAAEGAAERAIEAGYSKVSVMPEGITGWRAAGLSTDQI